MPHLDNDNLFRESHVTYTNNTSTKDFGKIVPCSSPSTYPAPSQCPSTLNCHIPGSNHPTSAWSPAVRAVPPGGTNERSELSQVSNEHVITHIVARLDQGNVFDAYIDYDDAYTHSIHAYTHPLHAYTHSIHAYTHPLHAYTHSIHAYTHSIHAYTRVHGHSIVISLLDGCMQSTNADSSYISLASQWLYCSAGCYSNVFRIKYWPECECLLLWSPLSTYIYSVSTLISAHHPILRPPFLICQFAYSIAESIQTTSSQRLPPRAPCKVCCFSGACILTICLFSAVQMISHCLRLHQF